MFGFRPTTQSGSTEVVSRPPAAPRPSALRSGIHALPTGSGALTAKARRRALQEPPLASMLAAPPTAPGRSGTGSEQPGLRNPPPPRIVFGGPAGLFGRLVPDLSVQGKGCRSVSEGGSGVGGRGVGLWASMGAGFRGATPSDGRGGPPPTPRSPPIPSAPRRPVDDQRSRLRWIDDRV